MGEWFNILMTLVTLILGLGVWRLQWKITKNEQKREVDEKKRQDYQVMALLGSAAAAKLGKATAIALQGGKLNGEMKDALEYMLRLEAEQDSFIKRQCIENIFKGGNGNG